MANETQVASNQGTPDADVAAKAAQAAGQAAEAGDGGAASAPASAPTASTDKGGQPAGKAGLDYQKSYKELQGEFTRRSQENSELRRMVDELSISHKQLAELISKATEKPVDPEQFLEEFKTHGPKALEPYFQKHIDALKSTYDKSNAEQAQTIRNLESQVAVMAHINDAENYPDFRALLPTMQSLAEDSTCPVDFSKPMTQVLDALYKLAMNQNGVEAIKLAEAEATKKADADLANEAKTAVAGGGKAGTTMPDLHRMPLQDLEKFVTQLHGIADR